ncbi:hypothetical protein CTI12_AA398660 [Artemisia annua]|uniref:25S rRNA (uridine-N(3))-methyltransferase BMT5-like domain-containing protein n=1 Tax=Artemisia annua TaxID=35608 RepID=A0A2U1MBC8_ARTAN|nr:hypothetical protein CTI12_AA398660 [Artemisia annua]
MARIPWESYDNYGENVKWVKHYCSNHQILLVGEGDFSFSYSLAMAFGDASNIVATSLDSYDVVIKKYERAKANLDILYRLGAQLSHGVDATKMKLHTDLQMRKFDRIVYNFPHAGFLGKEYDNRVITKHKNLVCGFFKNASRMLRPYGEVHVSHKTAYPFNLWNIEELASQNSLSLFEHVKFEIQDYPGYNNKRGEDVVIKKYERAKANLDILYRLGAQLSHGVDATKMKLHTDLQMRKFDRIVYNFPHAGFLGKEYDNRVITKHKNLVCGFFKNASRMLRPYGEVHVSHKTAYPFNLWNIEELASQNSLSLFEHVKFEIQDYPGYNNKRGEEVLKNPKRVHQKEGTP